MKTISLEPDYNALTEYFARGLAEHQWERGYLLPPIQLVEMVRYLQQIDPKGLEATLTRLRRRYHQNAYGDGLYVKYCDSYDSVTQSCSHSKPPQPVVEGVTVITAEGTTTGDLMEDDSIRLRDDHVAHEEGDARTRW